jgi:hypothetical protein
MNMSIALIVTGLSLFSVAPVSAATIVISGNLTPDSSGVIQYSSEINYNGNLARFDLALDRPMEGFFTADYGLFYSREVFRLEIIEQTFDTFKRIKTYEYEANDLGQSGYGVTGLPVSGDQFRTTIRVSEGTIYSKTRDSRTTTSYFAYPRYVEFGGQVSGTSPVGYTLTITSAGGVPEPDSWALMITGFGMIGAGLRRARRLQRQMRLA